jgi:DNA-binding transcriptional ArsR family regulator
MARTRREGAARDDVPESVYRVCRMMKTLGNPQAYALVRLLAGEEDGLPVHEIAARLRRSQPAVSAMLRSLRDQDIARCRREGKCVIYGIRDAGAMKTLMDRTEALVRKL